jgi:hypothetical protein
MNIDSFMVDILQPTKVILPMLDCSNSSRIESDLSYSLCLSQHMLLLNATNICFTYICKLSCTLYTLSYCHDHISICSTYQSSAVKAWYPISIHLHILDWFTLIYRKFDHRSSVRTLELILHNKTVYIFVPHRISICFTYTCKLSCNLDYENTTHVRKIHTTFYIYIYSAYTFFLFLPLPVYQKPRTAFHEEREDDEDIIRQYDHSTCLSWKEILSLTDDYYG